MHLYKSGFIIILTIKKGETIVKTVIVENIQRREVHVVVLDSPAKRIAQAEKALNITLDTLHPITCNHESTQKTKLKHLLGERRNVSWKEHRKEQIQPERIGHSSVRKLNALYLNGCIALQYILNDDIYYGRL
jgi:hypothetical protein